MYVIVKDVHWPLPAYLRGGGVAYYSSRQVMSSFEDATWDPH